MNHFKELLPGNGDDFEGLSEGNKGFYAISQVSPTFKNLFLCDRGLSFFRTSAELFMDLSLKTFCQNSIHPKFHGIAFQLVRNIKILPNDLLKITNILIRPAPLTPFSMHVVCIKHLPTDPSSILFHVIPLQINDNIQKKLNRLQDECNFRQKYIDRFVLLTPREKRILIETSQGVSSKEIAENLFISTNTVETHKKNIQKKLRGKKKDFILFALSFDLVDQLFKKHI